MDADAAERENGQWTMALLFVRGRHPVPRLPLLQSRPLLSKPSVYWLQKNGRGLLSPPQDRPYMPLQIVRATPESYSPHPTYWVAKAPVMRHKRPRVQRIIFLRALRVSSLYLCLALAFFDSSFLFFALVFASPPTKTGRSERTHILQQKSYSTRPPFHRRVCSRRVHATYQLAKIPPADASHYREHRLNYPDFEASLRVQSRRSQTFFISLPLHVYAGQAMTYRRAWRTCVRVRPTTETRHRRTAIIDLLGRCGDALEKL
ncbi:hypothetical protein PLICRDRAFT_645511 [Plicaturopsis crispa FD-325 SS-3]|nr:hypothetical protein PLICRDRAFT_645511 [Plicaturopsis crispa FD-325 SS-3]